MASRQRGGLQYRRRGSDSYCSCQGALAKWEGICLQSRQPRFDSEPRLHGGRTQTVRGLSVEQVLTSSTLVGHPKICPVSSDGRAPVLQTGSRRIETSTGHQIWARSDNGSTPVLQTGSGDSTSPASTKFERSWFSGRIRHCQCRGAGSIPADRSRICGCSSMGE